MTEVDWAVSFSIHKYQDSFISHGEVFITRVDRQGRVMWRFGGADIFVCLSRGNPFDLQPDYSALTDFEGHRYKINYDGEEIK